MVRVGSAAVIAGEGEALLVLTLVSVVVGGTVAFAVAGPVTVFVYAWFGSGPAR
jgi:hypothetical protein